MSPKTIRLFGSWAVPLVIAAAYLFLIETIDPSLTVALLTLAGLLCVLVLWFLFRGLAAHAAITRAIAVGEPDEVVTRARNASDHRYTRRGRMPFRIYEAIGLGLRGEWAASLAALEGTIDERSKPPWRLLVATARVAAATALGDAPAARTAFDVVKALARPTDVCLKECEARVLYVEGDRAGAGALFRALADNIRLGPAPRAAALYYAGRCEDDAAAARTLFERAIGLAPKTWIKAAAADQLR